MGLFGRRSIDAEDQQISDIIHIAIEEEPGSEVWRACVEKLRGSLKKRSSELLIEIAKTNPPFPCGMRVWGLIGEMGGWQVPLLAKLVNHEAPTVRYSAAIALKCIAEDQKTFVFYRQWCIDCLKKTAKKNPDPDMKELAGNPLSMMATK
jgi:HEAT repeat.